MNERDNNLRAFRKSMQLTIKQMAKTLGVSLAAYTQVEYGERKASGGFMRKFKRTFPTYDMNCFF